MRHSGLRAVAVILASVLAVSALAATRAYFVEPKTAANGWSPYQGWVGQTFVANVDSIYYIEWFVGELSAEGLDMPLASA